MILTNFRRFCSIYMFLYIFCFGVSERYFIERFIGYCKSLFCNYWVPLILSILAFALASCRVSDSPQVIVHPISDRIPDIEKSHDFVSRDHNSKDILNAQQLAKNLLLSPKVLTLGVLEGKRHETFGQISDIRLDGAGNMYILDTQFSEVRVFNPEGSFLYSIGSSGRGTGEFFMAEGIEVDSTGRVYVGDKSRRNSVFQRLSNSHQYEYQMDLPFVPIDQCRSGNAHFIHGIPIDAPSHVIHSYSEDRNVLNTFGSLYNSTSPLVQHYLGEGHISCSDDPIRIIFAPRLLPIIYGYSQEGQLMWVKKISNFKSLSITENIDTDTGEPEVSMDIFSHEFNQISNIIAFPEQYAIVQIASFTPESLNPEFRKGENFASLKSYLILFSTGEAIYIGDSLPQIRAISHKYLYTSHSFPFPQVSVYQYDFRSNN